MKLSDLQTKDIVNVNDGKKVGRIIDAEISSDGVITGLVIEAKKGLSNFLSREEETTITFKQIKKIGTDVILIDF